MPITQSPKASTEDSGSAPTSTRFAAVWSMFAASELMLRLPSARTQRLSIMSDRSKSVHDCGEDAAIQRTQHTIIQFRDATHLHPRGTEECAVEVGKIIRTQIYLGGLYTQIASNLQD